MAAKTTWDKETNTVPHELAIVTTNQAQVEQSKHETDCTSEQSGYERFIARLRQPDCLDDKYVRFTEEIRCLMSTLPARVEGRGHGGPWQYDGSSASRHVDYLMSGTCRC